MNGSTLSESVQMYLVTIIRLQTDEQPVSLSQLARRLSISPVSVNEMCRRLQEQGLAIYRPYKGVLLTAEGKRQACQILRRHRLWEVFLVERLGFEPSQAHEAACRLEHATPELLVERLDAFLGYPQVNPFGQPVPRPQGEESIPPSVSLLEFPVGRRAYFVRYEGDEAARAFLQEEGLSPGSTFEVVAVGQENLLLKKGSHFVALARGLAQGIKVRAAIGKGENGEETMNKMQETMNETQGAETVTRVSLDKLGLGQKGVVVHVSGQGFVRQRTMDMGIVPGTVVKVVKVAPLGDPIEFEVKGYNLSLRRSEAENIIVELLEEER